MLKRFISVFLLAAAGGVRADAGLSVNDPWIRYLPGDGPMAGYFVLSNDSDASRTLVGASSAAFGLVQLHRTMKENDMSSMSPVDAVTIPAHGRIVFRPGDYHLMLMQRRRELQVGGEPTVILRFKDGRDLEVSFTIKPPWQEQHDAATDSD